MTKPVYSSVLTRTGSLHSAHSIWSKSPRVVVSLIVVIPIGFQQPFDCLIIRLTVFCFEFSQFVASFFGHLDVGCVLHPAQDSTTRVIKVCKSIVLLHRPQDIEVEHGTDRSQYARYEHRN